MLLYTLNLRSVTGRRT